MVSVFLDANIIIDIFEGRKKIALEKLAQHKLHYSPLTVHIYIYLYKKKMPLPEISIFFEKLGAKAVPISQKLMRLALNSPTKDFEDNIQLHSAVEAKCNYFLTNDKTLLKMHSFNKTKIINKL